ncbi:MAG TPA: hypothetical protein VFU86_12775, partial [Terriglobales bacterium]|nr:hypothetical protein [Terriglobales bacterium]
MSSLPSRVLRWFCDRLDERHRPWGEAMLAELDHLEGTSERLVWAFGGVTVMTRMLMKQWFHAGTRSFSGGDILISGAKPPRRRWLPILFALLSVILLFVPEVRQAISVVSASLGAMRGSLAISESRLEHVFARGTRDRNAQLVALAAISSSDEAHQRAWADEAIRLDPNLTWINSVVISRAAERVLNSNLAPQQRIEGLADARQRVASLEAWDPGNAVPYLLEAELAVKDPDIFWKAEQHGVSLLNTEPGWLSAMHKAFAAERYDSYRKRRFELGRVAPEAFGSSAAWSTVIGLINHPIPNLMMLRAFGDYLVGEDARRGSGWPAAQRVADDTTTPVQVPVDLPASFGDPARMSNYWQAALFGERMQLADTNIEKLIGIAIEIPAYRSLMVAAQRTHQPELETAIGYRLRQLNHEALASQNPGRRSEADAIAWLAGLISLATLIAILSATLLALSAAYHVAGLVWEKV